MKGLNADPGCLFGPQRAVELALAIGAPAHQHRDAALHVEQHHGGLARIHGLAFGLDEIMHQLLCTPLQDAVDRSFDDDLTVVAGDQARQPVEHGVDGVFHAGLATHYLRFGKPHVGY